MFYGVTIDKTDRSYDNGQSGDIRVRFLGTYKSTAFDSENKSILLMGGGNTLYYPLSGASIGACRAYFALNGITAGDPASDVRAFVLNFGDEVDGISDISTSRNDEIPNDAWYTLDGRRLSAKPTAPGLYIHGNKKVMVDAVGIR